MGFILIYYALDEHIYALHIYWIQTMVELCLFDYFVGYLYVVTPIGPHWNAHITIESYIMYLPKSLLTLLNIMHLLLFKALLVMS